MPATVTLQFADKAADEDSVEVATVDQVVSLLTAEPLALSNIAQLNDLRTMRALLAQMGVAIDAARGTGTAPRAPSWNTS